MIHIKKVKLQDIQREWTELEKNNPYLSPFQEYSFASLLNSHYLFYRLKKKEKPIFYALYENEECILIAPLCYRIKQKEYTTFGRNADIAFQDFIYSKHLDIFKMKECLTILLKVVKKISFCNLKEDSLLYKTLCTIPSASISVNRVNYYIDGRDYETWFRSLSKGIRQNVRTSYNRMNSDGKTFNYQIYDSTTIPSKLYKETIKCYVSRRASRYHSTSFLHNIFLKKYHYNTIGFRTMNNAMYSVLTIDGEVAAFWGGYFDAQKNYVIVPRLSINEKFSRYSPGIVLINETIKVLQKNYGISIFDLSKGDEKYKIYMGGKQYDTYYCLLEEHMLHSNKEN